MEDKEPYSQEYKTLSERYTTHQINEMLNLISEKFNWSFIVMGKFDTKKVIKHFLIITSAIALFLIVVYGFPLITFFTPLIPIALYLCFHLRDMLKMMSLTKVCLIDLPKYGYNISIKETIYLIYTILEHRKNEESQNNY